MIKQLLAFLNIGFVDSETLSYIGYIFHPKTNTYISMATPTSIKFTNVAQTPFIPLRGVKADSVSLLEASTFNEVLALDSSKIELFLTKHDHPIGDFTTNTNPKTYFYITKEEDYFYIKYKDDYSYKNDIENYNCLGVDSSKNFELKSENCESLNEKNNSDFKFKVVGTKTKKFDKKDIGSPVVLNNKDVIITGNPNGNNNKNNKNGGIINLDIKPEGDKKPILPGEHIDDLPQIDDLPKIDNLQSEQVNDKDLNKSISPEIPKKTVKPKKEVKNDDIFKHIDDTIKEYLDEHEDKYHPCIDSKKSIGPNKENKEEESTKEKDLESLMDKIKNEIKKHEDLKKNSKK